MIHKSKSATILTIVTAVVCTVAGVGTALYALSLEASEKGSIETVASASSSHSSTEHASKGDDKKAAKPTGKVARAIIIYNNEGFMNPTYIVNAGDTVRVENKSSREFYFMTSDQHDQAASSHDHGGATSVIDVSTLVPGESSSFTAPAAGTYKFHNHHNQSDAAELIVQ